jgi:nitroreductase
MPCTDISGCPAAPAIVATTASPSCIWSDWYNVGACAGNCWYSGYQAQVRDCPLLLVFIADLSRLDRVSERGGGRADANRFLEMFLVASVDAALAAQNALVAAESLGLGTCYIGAMRNHPEQVAEVLGLPPDAFAVFGLCIGWPDPARPGSIIRTPPPPGPSNPGSSVRRNSPDWAAAGPGATRCRHPGR